MIGQKISYFYIQSIHVLTAGGYACCEYFFKSLTGLYEGKEVHFMNINQYPLAELDAASILAHASGPVSIPMTNDYLFRALLQANNRVLTDLIASLLHLNQDSVKSVVITNAILLGSQINEKTYILDIRVLLNDDTSINLEMQVVNEHNWPERSMCYLCRSFDKVNKGDEYAAVHPAIQIGILDFTLFPDSPEFYASYYLMNEKNHRKYSDKLRISVLDLTQMKIATDEDRKYHIDYWALFFKAKTWEELKDLAKEHEIFEDAAATIYLVSHEENIRLQCEAREDYYRRKKDQERRFNEVYSKNAELTRQYAELTSQHAELASQNIELASQNIELASQNTELESQNTELTSQNTELASQKKELTSQNKELTSMMNALADKSSKMEEEIKRLHQLLEEQGIKKD